MDLGRFFQETIYFPKIFFRNGTPNGGCQTFCENTYGGFICSCENGFKLDLDEKSCIDIDECVTGDNGCHANANCTNNEGGYTCACKTGFIGDGKDTCAPPSCNTGYFFDIKTMKCIDFDECASGLNDCHADATCMNTDGGYTCACPDGLIGDGKDTCAPPSCDIGYFFDGKTCIDFDECATGLNNCHADATCTNNEGGYTCACKNGFIGDGKDTCTMSCDIGFFFDGKTCVDFDECATGLNNCHADATCTNTEGGFTCKCKSGFTGNGKNCIITTTPVIDTTPTTPSVPPLCDAGYFLDIKTLKCIDFDECSTGLNDCHDDAECTNTDGGYACECKSGFIGNGTDCTATTTTPLTPSVTPKPCPAGSTLSDDGLTCVDIDECVTGDHICHRNARCINHEDGYTCKCKSGFEGNGFTCIDVVPCPAGFKPAANVKMCVDIDECATGGYCHSEAICRNTEGSYQCKCKDGFEGDGKRTCKEISNKEPCKENNDPCNKNENNIANINFAPVNTNRQNFININTEVENEIDFDNKK